MKIFKNNYLRAGHRDKLFEMREQMIWTRTTFDSITHQEVSRAKKKSRARHPSRIAIWLWKMYAWATCVYEIRRRIIAKPTAICFVQVRLAKNYRVIYYFISRQPLNMIHSSKPSTLKIKNLDTELIFNKQNIFFLICMIDFFLKRK